MKVSKTICVEHTTAILMEKLREKKVKISPPCEQLILEIAKKNKIK